VCSDEVDEADSNSRFVRTSVSVNSKGAPLPSARTRKHNNVTARPSPAVSKQAKPAHKYSKYRNIQCCLYEHVKYFLNIFLVTLFFIKRRKYRCEIH
jgi:hypothetical protein